MSYNTVRYIGKQLLLLNHDKVSQHIYFQVIHKEMSLQICSYQI